MSFLGKLSLLGLVAALLGACATQPPPITKLVNGRQITTRSVDPNAYEHFARALLYEDQERWQDAADEIQRAILFDDDSPELHAHLAELLLRLGRDKDAESEVRDSLKLGPSASGLLADAHVRRAKGDAAGEVAALRRATSEVDFDADNDDAESVYLELAEAELQTLDLPSAQSTLEVLTQAEPASAAGSMRLTAVYWALGAMAKAEATLHAALTEEPNQIEALVALAWIDAASGKNDDARTAFREAIDRSEGAPEIAAAFARFLVGIGSQKEADQLADDLAVPDSSLDAESLGGRVELERSARRLDRALALLARARALGIAENQKTRLSLTQAAILKEQGKSDEALAVLMKVGKTSPLYFEARLRAAELLRDTHKAAEATRLVEEAAAAAKDPDDTEVEAAVSLALIDEKRGDAMSGVARLEKIVARHPDQSQAIMLLAAIEERRGNWQHALDIVERYLAKDPGSVEALNFWGFVAADHEHALDLAKKRLQAACALDPGSGGLIDSLGWVYFRGKDLGQSSSLPGTSLPPRAGGSGNSVAPGRALRREQGQRTRRRRLPTRARVQSRRARATQTGRRPGEARGEVMHFHRRGMVIVLAAFTAGCAGSGQMVRSYPAPSAAELLQAVRARQAAVRGMNVETRATSWLGGQRVRGTVQMLVERSGRLRFEAEVALQGTVAVLTVDGGQFAFIDHQKHLFRRGPACPANVAALIRIPLAPAEVAAILLGDIPLPEGSKAAAVEWDSTRGADVLGVESQSGARLWLGLRRPNSRIPAWDIVFVEGLKVGAHGRWRVSYEDFERVAGVALPRLVRFAEPGRDFDDGVEIKVRERTLNPSFPTGAFTLEPPPGYKVELAACGAPH